MNPVQLGAERGFLIVDQLSKASTMKVILTKHLCRLVLKMSLRETKLCLAAEIARWLLVVILFCGAWIALVYAYRFTFG